MYTYAACLDCVSRAEMCCSILIVSLTVKLSIPLVSKVSFGHTIHKQTALENSDRLEHLCSETFDKKIDLAACQYQGKSIQHLFDLGAIYL